jgi:hypothetical protein
MRYLMKVVLLYLLTTYCHGQDIEITVRVIDQLTKKPIKNANVVVSGTTRGTTTNVLGFFKLSLTPNERKLVISHISYRTEPIDVPADINSFTVPLTKTVYKLSDIDLKQYPNNFKLEKSIVREFDLRKSELDSMIVVESFANFPYEGGVETFSQFFGNTFQFPQKELKDKQEGRLLLEFTIDKNGDYKSIRCLLLDSLNGICNECKRVLTVLPKWIPGQQRGENMEQIFVVPIYFGLNDYWRRELKRLRK